MELIQNYISGKYVDPRSNSKLELHEPATGVVYGQLIDSNSEDVQEAVSSAKNAFPSWSALSLVDRSNYLMAIAEEINNQADNFSKFESRDTGKPLSLARSLDIPRAISNFKFFAEHAKDFKFEWERLEREHSARSLSASGWIPRKSLRTLMDRLPPPLGFDESLGESERELEFKTVKQNLPSRSIDRDDFIQLNETLSQLAGRHSKNNEELSVPDDPRAAEAFEAVRRNVMRKQLKVVNRGYDPAAMPDKVLEEVFKILVILKYYWTTAFFGFFICCPFNLFFLKKSLIFFS